MKKTVCNRHHWFSLHTQVCLFLPEVSWHLCTLLKQRFCNHHKLFMRMLKISFSTFNNSSSCVCYVLNCNCTFIYSKDYCEILPIFPLIFYLFFISFYKYIFFPWNCIFHWRRLNMLNNKTILNLKFYKPVNLSNLSP